MATSYTFIGIDISKKTFNAAYLNEKDQWLEKEFTNNAGGRKALLQWAPKEASFETAKYLFEKGHIVYVQNPLRVKRFSQMKLERTKTDRTDARMIARYARANVEDLTVWVPAKANLSKARCYQKQITQTSNCMEALHQLSWAREAERELKKVLMMLENALKRLEKEALNLVMESEGDLYHRLVSVPGIGVKTAVSLIVCTHGFAHFDNSKQLCAYVGLSPRIYESGSSVKGKGHLCKQGNPYIRRNLYLCAVSSMTCNPVCRSYKAHLMDRGKPAKVALVAVANKLLRIAFAIAKSGCSWNPDRLHNEIA